MAALVGSRFLPEAVLMRIGAAGAGDWAALVPGAQDYEAVSEKSTAYVCRNLACGQPVTDIGKFSELIEAMA